eukprot:Gb_19437 [translate_table: standard]
MVKMHRARLEECHGKRVMNLSALDFIRNFVLTDGYIQITIHQSQEFCNDQSLVTLFD